MNVIDIRPGGSGRTPAPCGVVRPADRKDPAVTGAMPAGWRTVAKLLGRIGTITHISCFDRLVAEAADSGSVEREYLHLLARGADQLAGMRDLLGVDPVRVMARCGEVRWQPAGLGSVTKVFLEMASGVHVQYHGSLASGQDQHELWVDGARGVLRADAHLVWFRKAGWPLFVPIAPSLGPRADRSSSLATKAAARRERLPAIERGGAADGVGGDRWPLAIAAAVMRADRTGRPVAITAPVETPSSADGSAA